MDALTRDTSYTTWKALWGQLLYVGNALSASDVGSTQAACLNSVQELLFYVLIVLCHSTPLASSATLSHSEVLQGCQQNGQ